MQPPRASTVWTYQTFDEQDELLNLYQEWLRVADQLDELNATVRRIKGRAYMRRNKGFGSFALDYWQPTLEAR